MVWDTSKVEDNDGGVYVDYTACKICGFGHVQNGLAMMIMLPIQCLRCVV